MAPTFDPMFHFFALWLVVVAALFIHRRLAAARSHLKAGLVFDDFLLAGVLSAATVTVLVILPGAGFSIAVLLTVAAGLWWLDGVVFCSTGFNITLENTKVAMQGWRTINADTPHVLRVMRRRLWSLGAPVSVSATLFVIAGENGISPADAVLLALAAAAVTVGAAKIRVTGWTLLGIVVMVGTLAQVLPSLPILSGASSTVLASALLALSLIAAARGQGQRFWQRKSPLRNFFGRRGLQVAAGQFVRDEKLFPELAIRPPHRTRYFGELQGHSVILVALESFSAWAMERAASGAEPRLPFLTSLQSRGIFSNEHYAISPNTNQAFEYLYRGGYPSAPNYPYLKALRAAGYHTALRTTQDLNDFRRFEIVERAGFDEVIDKKGGGFVAAEEDYNLLRWVDWVAERLHRGPTFIHVMNNQPHSPYVVVDRARFGASDNDRRLRYLAALAETDFILGRWFEELAKRVDLATLLVVVVGDHGQSFGELGYDMHSSSTIKEQVRVPLWMLHPRFTGRTHSGRTSHLDLMPTILDLLGIETDASVHGSSLFDEGRCRDYLLHSEVRVRGIPAQMSLLRGEEKWMTDIINGVSYHMDEEDKIRKILSASEQRHLHAVLGRVLQERGMWPEGG